MQRVPILMYHQVSPDPPADFRKYCVTPRQFRLQMRWLSTAGYTTVNLDTLLQARARGRDLPGRPVVITFDDGFRDCIHHTVPVLAEFGFSAAFYLVAGLLGGASGWLRPKYEMELPLADWDTARRLNGAGHTCGAHTVMHPDLTQVSTAVCREELFRAREILEDRLGHAVRHLAYPFGSYDEQVRGLAQEAGYRSACSVRIGLSTAEDDPFALHRVPVLGTDSIADFIVRLRTARTAKEFARRVVLGARRRLIPPRRQPA